MMNLREWFEFLPSYEIQKDYPLRGISYFFGVALLLGLLRQQVAEVNLLQLVPGFYLFFYFLGFLFLTYFSSIAYFIALQLETKQKSGPKSIEKWNYKINLKWSFFFFYSGLVVVLNSVVPLGLDSFNSYAGKTLENVWSFGQVLSLEIILLIFLVTLGQSPLLFLKSLYVETSISTLPKFWKKFTFGICLASGFLTPTIDGYTQVSFASSTLSLYLIVINLVAKRLNYKMKVLALKT